LYCAYQERSIKEVSDKLAIFSISSTEKDQITRGLIDEGFLDESRYAIAFAGGKFRMKKWGKVKIAYHLKHHNLDETLIRNALDSLDKTEYRDTIENLIITKAKTLDSTNNFQKMNKIARFMISKGFEPDITWEIINSLKLR